MSIVNDLFSRVYYINLDARVERKKLIEEQLNKLNIVYERFSATVGNPWGWLQGLNGGEAGCINSHLRVLEQAKKDNLNSILILEDDAVFCNNFDFKFYEAYRTVPKEWQMLYLGGNNNSPFNSKISHRLNNYVYKSLSTLTTASYVVKKEIYDILINRIQTLDKSLDLMYVDIQPKINAYCLVPALVTQRSGYSDIQQCKIDYKEMIK